MSEKVLHEVRIIETEDGFRIEVKGDKERMRQMGFGPGMGFGRMHRYGRRGPWRHGHGPGPFMHGFGPWWMWDDEDEEPEPRGEPTEDK